MNKTNPTPTQQGQTLEPCPLAHAEEKGLHINSSGGMRKWHITCFDCGLYLEGMLDETIRSLAQRWNTRAAVAGPRGDSDLISRRVAVEIADARLNDVPDSVDLEADRSLFAAGYLAAAGSIKAGLLRAATASPAPAESDSCSHWREGDSDNCPLCGDDLGPTSEIDVATPAERTRVEGEQEK